VAFTCIWSGCQIYFKFYDFNAEFFEKWYFKVPKFILELNEIFGTKVPNLSSEYNILITSNIVVWFFFVCLCST